MQHVDIPFGGDNLVLDLPDGVDILAMGDSEPLGDAALAIRRSLDEPIGSDSLASIVARRRSADPDATAVIVVSDHTRPVPYKGDDGILWPIVEVLKAGGMDERRISVLVATGTHHGLDDSQLRAILDPRVFDSQITVINHDSRDPSVLVDIGATPRGTRALVNRHYLDADIKILTGLVETHFIAGYSGGRKAICPGLVGEEATHVFHGPEIMADPETRDLNLDSNPLHHEAMAVAEMAGWDFIVNVTLNTDFRITGVFSGHLDQAHRAACAHLAGYVAIHPSRRYDLVITHGAFVGINHYQAVKPGLAAMAALADDAAMLIVASHTDSHRIGSPRYQTLVHLLSLIGPEAYRRLIFSPDWHFLPDQWEVQAWASLLDHLRDDGLYYYAPQLTPEEYEFLPGVDANTLLPDTCRYSDDAGNVQKVIDAVIDRESRAAGSGRDGAPSIAFMLDGPYGIV